MTTDQQMQGDRPYETNPAWFINFASALAVIAGIHPFDTRLNNESLFRLDQTPYATICKMLNDNPALHRLDHEPHPLPHDLAAENPKTPAPGVSINALMPLSEVPFAVFIRAREAAGRMVAMPTQSKVTLTRQEINDLLQAVPEFSSFAETALL